MTEHRGSTSRGKSSRPTVRGWGVSGCAALALVLAAYLQRQDLLIVGIFLSVVVLAAMITVALNRPTFTVSRSLSPDTVAAGDTAEVLLAIRNPSSQATRAALWRDRVSPGLRAQRAGALPSLAEHRLSGHSLASRGYSDAALLRHTVGADRRGMYQVGPMLVGITDPFGLAFAEHAVGPSRLLVVTPRVADLDGGNLDITSNDGTVHELLRHTNPSADELIAREYRPGDPLRRVHWRATARHGELMVRQEEQRSNPEAWVVFDGRSVPRPERTSFQGEPATGTGTDAYFETAVEMVAALGAHLIREGFGLNVAETARRQIFSGSATRGDLGGSPHSFFEHRTGIESFLRALAGVKIVPPAADDYLLRLSGALQRAGKAVPLFAVLREGTHPDLASLAALRPFCQPAVAFLIGPASDADTVLADTVLADTVLAGTVLAGSVLADAGWVCVRLTEATGVEDAARLAFAQAVAGHDG